MTPEDQARQRIDEMLTASGWVIQDYRALNLAAGRGIAVREVPLKSGPCDYLLLVDRKPVESLRPKRREPRFQPSPISRVVTLPVCRTFWLPS